MNPASKGVDDLDSDLDRPTVVRFVIAASHRVGRPGYTPLDHPLHFDADDPNVAV